LKLEHQAFYDALTDLPNRQLFLNRFNQHLHQVKRTGLFGALLYLDVDDFKFINDSFGHSVGDEILKHISLILTQKIRASDTAARFGGDEFLVLLTDLSDNKITAGIEAEAIARKIYAKLLESFTFKERPFRIEVSIGIALFPDKHATVDDIICEADIAMYRNKTKMKGINQTHDPVAMFDKDEHRLVKDRLYTYQCLRDALTNDEFFLEYQPQVDIDQNIKGAECLIRWKPINEGVVSPAAFIPILEDGSLIIDVGEWVLTEACHVLSTWNDQSDYFAQLTLAVNISALQFNADDFPERVMAILNSTGANPHRLVLEITESMSIKDLKRTVDKMNKLKDIGVSFSIDDFGTGYSSLTYIKKLPIDTLKIDRSFVRNVHEDSDNEVFVNLFMQMAKNFNFSVVVEGVETSSELTVLLNNGCDVFQGFYFSKPLSLKDLEAFCQETDKDFVGTL
jgi:diguanylate cyclase (GGDEF)-like protein